VSNVVELRLGDGVACQSAARRGSCRVRAAVTEDVPQNADLEPIRDDPRFAEIVAVSN
jgi:hypothetical protein